MPTLTSPTNRDMVFPLLPSEVSSGGEHCTFHVKATFLAVHFVSSPEHFTRGLKKNWKTTGAWCCGLFKKQNRIKKHHQKIKEKKKEIWLENQIFLPKKLHHLLFLQHRTQMGPRQQSSLLLVHVINLAQAMLLIDASFADFQCH